MPVEREFKFVLKHEGTMELLNSMVRSHYISVIDIEQGYLSKGGRVRKLVTRIARGEAQPSPFFERKFTYKHAMSHKPGVLEFEQDIDDQDFADAWTDADHPIVKTRYRFPVNDLGQQWEIDFFYDKDRKVYLVMAECELYRENAVLPSTVPEFLTQSLLYSVKEGDKRFTNRRLSNVKKVRKLLKEIGNEAKAKSSSLS